MKHRFKVTAGKGRSLGMGDLPDSIVILPGYDVPP